MFVPEFSSKDTFVLVHNHLLDSEKAVRLSATFTHARLHHASRHLPEGVSRVEVIFDCRGQNMNATAEKLLTAKALGADLVTFKRV